MYHISSNFTFISNLLYRQGLFWSFTFHFYLILFLSKRMKIALLVLNIPMYNIINTTFQSCSASSKLLILTFSSTRLTVLAAAILSIHSSWDREFGQPENLHFLKFEYIKSALGYQFGQLWYHSNPRILGYYMYICCIRFVNPSDL